MLGPIHSQRFSSPTYCLAANHQRYFAPKETRSTISPHCAPCSSLPIDFLKRPGRNHFIRFDHRSGCWRAGAEIPSLGLATSPKVGDARPVVFDISSDGEGWVETKGSCGIGGDDYDWISELLGDKVGDTETDDSDDVVLFGGIRTLNRGRSLPVLLRMIWMMIVWC
ncbi:hypothetical protein U1Q18_005017 [Sarracenia purpurea var. burkii]